MIVKMISHLQFKKLSTSLIARNQPMIPQNVFKVKHFPFTQAYITNLIYYPQQISLIGARESATLLENTQSQTKKKLDAGQDTIFYKLSSSNAKQKSKNN